MKMNRHLLHYLLVEHPHQKPSFSLFNSKSSIRQAIERIRIDLEVHEKEKYFRFNADLNDDEMAQLITDLKDYIRSNQRISDLSIVDHQMIHQLMCTSLIAYELDQHGYDNYRKIIDDYFQRFYLDQHDEKPQAQMTSLNIWLNHLIDYPHFYIAHIFVGGHGNDYRLPSLDLAECGCVDISHDRLLSDVRSQAQRLVIEQCKKYQASAKAGCVKILSLGSGEGLQDFILMLNLFRSGVRNIELTLVEPRYERLLAPQQKIIKNWQAEWKEGEKIPQKYYLSNQDELYNFTRAISLLARCFDDSHISISQYHSVSSLMQDSRRANQYDLIYAIDLDEYTEGSEAFNDFHALAPCVATQGTAIVSHHYLIERFSPLHDQEASKFKQIEMKEFQAPPVVNGGYAYKHAMKDFFR
jgi:hypothetical protein